jgi:1-deoxy-D-xylulose-5-phosphate reductoisomerase
LAAQARDLNARFAAVADPGAYRRLKDALWGTGIEAAAGRTPWSPPPSGRPSVVMAAIVGAAGLAPTMAAIRRGASSPRQQGVPGLRRQLMVAEVARHGARLLPVDSEHSAIFQVFEVDNADRVARSS